MRFVFADKLADFIGAFKPPIINKQSGCVCACKTRLEPPQSSVEMYEIQWMNLGAYVSFRRWPTSTAMFWVNASFAPVQSTHNLCTCEHTLNQTLKQNEAFGKRELMPKGKTNKQSVRGRLIWMIEMNIEVAMGKRDCNEKWDENWM